MIELFAAGASAEPDRTVGGWTDDASSPQAEEPLSTAVTAARVLPGPTLRTVAAAAGVAAAGAWALRRAAR
jgi:hypothetical protein